MKVNLTSEFYEIILLEKKKKLFVLGQEDGSYLYLWCVVCVKLNGHCIWENNLGRLRFEWKSTLCTFYIQAEY